MYIVSVLMILFTVLNYVFGCVLYKEPEDETFFENVHQVTIEKNRYILPEPRYALISSMVTGLMLGLYLSLAKYYHVSKWMVILATAVVSVSYLFEMTRKLVLDSEYLTHTRFFLIKKAIPVSEIKGLFVYSYNKKWLKQHALTTKLVVTLKNGKKYPITLASFSNKKIFNMLKDNFGITHHKMYIFKNSGQEEA